MTVNGLWVCSFLAWIIQNLKCDVKIIEFFVVMSVLWRKGANCFAPVAHSVCRSVCRPSDVRSIFLDPLLESGQTWYGGGCLLRVDDHNYFVATWSKVKVLWPVFEKILSAQCLLTPFARKSPNSVQWMPLESFPYWFSDHMAKGQDQTPKFCLLKILWFKLWIKGKLSTANHRNASQNIVVYFAIKPSRS